MTTTKLKKKRRSGATEEQVKAIWESCDKLIETLSTSEGLSKYQIAKEVHYRIQRAPSYRINPTDKQKKESVKYWGNQCWKCKSEFNKDREFHHLRRNLDNPHQTKNMVPICKRCHLTLKDD